MKHERKERQKVGKDGVIFAVLNNGKLLLEERLDKHSKYYGFTTIPGGGVEHGESILQTLEREMLEELGCMPTISYYLSTRYQKDGDTVYKRHLILVAQVKGLIINNEPRKSKHVWASISEAKMICSHPSTQEFLTDIENYLSGKD